MKSELFQQGWQVKKFFIDKMRFCTWSFTVKWYKHIMAGFFYLFTILMKFKKYDINQWFRLKVQVLIIIIGQQKSIWNEYIDILDLTFKKVLKNVDVNQVYKNDWAKRIVKCNSIDCLYNAIHTIKWFETETANK